MRRITRPIAPPTLLFLRQAHEMASVAEHTAGNYRMLMNIADELLAAAAQRSLPKLDERPYFDIFQTPAPKTRAGAKER